MGYFAVRIDEIDPSGTSGAVRFVRHRHDARDSGQEEMNVIVRDSGAGTIFRFDPETTRRPVAGPEGFTMVAIGAAQGSYVPRGPF